MSSPNPVPTLDQATQALMQLQICSVGLSRLAMSQTALQNQLTALQNAQAGIATLNSELAAIAGEITLFQGQQATAQSVVAAYNAANPGAPLGN